MAMTPLPAAPQRTDPANFTTKADAFVAALPTFVTEANALEANVVAKEASAAAAAAAAELATQTAFETKSAMDADLNHPEDTLGYVLNDPTPGNNGMYRKTGASGAGSWAQSSYDRVLAVETRATALETKYDVIAPKNLHNPALATDGKIRDFSCGELATYAAGIALGKIPVQAGKRYTLWIPATEVAFFANSKGVAIYCWNASGIFLGIDHTIGATNGMANPPTDIVSRNTNHEVSFTIPEGSDIAQISTMMAYSTHTTADFTRIVNSIQCECADKYTDFEPYRTTSKWIAKSENLPTSKSFVVIKSGAYAYIRTSWSVPYDLVQKIMLGQGTVFVNDKVEFYGVRLIPSNTDNNAVVTAFDAASGNNILATQGDDGCPANYNGTYIGGGHGVSKVLEITATGHGKTVDDVGSEWTDGVGRKWYIMRIKDDNTLWVMSENIGTPPIWNFASAISGSTLNHNANAIHTGAIAIESSVVTQLCPANQNSQQSIYINSGLIPIIADGIYSAESVEIRDSYDIADPSAVLTYVISKVGSTTQPSFIDPSIASTMHFDIVYRFASNGSCTIYHSILTKINVTLGYIGFIQAGVVTYGSNKILQYIPKIGAIVGSLKTWYLANTEDITSQIEALLATSAVWLDANNPPERMAQIVRTTGGSPIFGFTLGYNLSRGIGVPAVRKTVVETGMFVYTSRKQYPYGINGTASAFTNQLLPANTVYETVAYRSFFNGQTVPEATVFTWYKDGDDIYVHLDFHENVTCLPIPLPKEFIGKKVSVIEKTDSFTLHTAECVWSNGLIVSVIDNFGYAVIKLS